MLASFRLRYALALLPLLPFVKPDEYQVKNLIVDTDIFDAIEYVLRLFGLWAFD